ncbi:YfcE family phosphodiesterase [Leuconostoc carnosum]|uniref:Phosphoesterase n=2 Tax=Leuconostoc carnosum TaxID=1252 RepID=K0DCZ2_LEUCJ|nr:YfcE family phosphodiesterase [Leuconostoc carnosum]AFT81422.1 phosphoesterase [Leuconostoc carnosum JB16]KAA8330233.1 YfcE family phosphodiesterase [Leuconostoc carnosum]KAA8381173.1 YfcE family phosphodiesterase [Leuconostoc carnosum]QEA33037.1 YfcE family phosphodiesterase [Leuconostoc carnosum]
MSKFLIVSDIHGDRAILVDILKQWHHQVDGVFYNGDSELPATDDVFHGVSTVIGNMDDDDQFADDQVVTIDGVTFFQTHGHLYRATKANTWANLDLMNQAANKAKAQVVLFGHTHIDGATIFDHKLFINPGSTTIPKGPRAALGGTYAVLTASDKSYVVNFYTRTHQLLPDLTVEVPR